MRTSIILRVILAISLLIVGVFFLRKIIGDDTANAVWMMLLGAICSALSLVLFVEAIRFAFWDSRKIRHWRPTRRTTEHTRQQISIS